jgi:hypothetical protein
VPTGTEKGFVVGISLPDDLSGLVSESHLLNGNAAAMVTRLALHSGSLHLATKASGKKKLNFQVELHANKLAYQI